MNILIVKLGSIGDIVHTLPSLAAIRESLPNARVSWVVEQRSAEILRGNTMIDELIEVDTRAVRKITAVDEALPVIARQIRGLRKRKFDIAVDLQGLLKSGIITQLSGARSRWGFARKELREPASRIFFTDTVNTPPETHIIRKNLKLVSEALSIPVPDRNFDFPIMTSEGDRLEAEATAADAGGPFAILNPAGGWVTKLWPAANFGGLADRLWLEMGIRSIVVTGPRESELANAVLENSSTSTIVLSEPSLKGFLELARRAAVYVGGDTGPTHLGVAAHAPVVGLFGPTEWWRNGSPNPDDICVERADIDCRVNCHRRSCSNWICMNSDIDVVFEAVRRRIAASAIHVG